MIYQGRRQIKSFSLRGTSILHYSLSRAVPPTELPSGILLQTVGEGEATGGDEVSFAATSSERPSSGPAVREEGVTDPSHDVPGLQELDFNNNI